MRTYLSSLQIARPRRVSVKAKDPSAATTVKTVPAPRERATLAPKASLPASTMARASPVLRVPEQGDQRNDEVLKSEEPTNDQQWQTVTSNRTQRKASLVATKTSRRRAPDESQTGSKRAEVQTAGKYPCAHPTHACSTQFGFDNFFRLTRCVLTSFLDNALAISSSSSRTRPFASNEPAKTHPHRGRPPTRNPAIPSTSTFVKRKSLQYDTPLLLSSQALAFAQLTEQLRAAGLPTAATACSMSIRSRCSSAPPSEHGGGDDDRTRSDLDTDEDEEDAIDWDEPEMPDDGNSISHTSMQSMASNLALLCTHLYLYSCNNG